MAAIEISKQTARRYLLGKQGLWPGRRWAGKVGAHQAILQIESVQVDPVSLIGRNHDLVLWSRVAGYTPAHLDELLYTDRLFFDYGGCLHIYPMSELPYWRPIMRKHREQFGALLAEHERAVEYVREELRKRGPLGNRDFDEKRTLNSYRSGKESGLALYYLWRSGELMTHSRRRFERIYDFAQNIVGGLQDMPCVSDEAAEEFFSRKAVREAGLATASRVAGHISLTSYNRGAAQKWLDSLAASGELAKASIEGCRDAYYLPACDLPLLDWLEAGGVPKEWQPLGNTTLEEDNFIAPLDNLLRSRKSVKDLFDFEYLWEIYKPAGRRRYGPYTMPILHGDRLVGRLNPRLDRKTHVLTIDGFWLEDDMLANNPHFQAALAAGLSRFALFHDAERVDFATDLPNWLMSSPYVRCAIK